jgi:hypothetical protein
LDCSETSGWNSYESEGIAYYGFEPIGTEENPFTGYFDGNNKTISNLYINRYGVNYIGLFGYVEPGENEGTGKIENLNLTNVDISGERYIGALVGYLGGTADNHGLIKNSHSSGEVEAFTLGAGGLIGLTGAYGDIEDSNSSVSASSWFKAGGLVGVAQGSIDNCYATGEVNITGYGAGGLVGYLKGGTIRESYATGDVGGGAAGEALDQTSSYAGGLVGLANLGKIYESYATGDVVGSSIRVGGLVGGTNSTIENSYALGDVEGTDRVGGLVGGSTGEIINSYSVGKVTVNGALILNEGDELIANDGGGGGGGYFGGEGGESDGIPGAGGSGFASSSVSNAILTTGNNGDGSERALPPNIDDENYITGVGLGGNYSLNSGNGLVYLNYGSGNITFSYTGESQTFTVPEGVTSINVKVWGAGGGGANYSDEYQGGSGGFAGGTITVNPRDILIIIVGGGGGRGISNTVGGVGGYGGGGYGTRGDAAGAGGGGLSGIFTDENGTDFESLTQGNAIIIAGGGGGGTGYSGPGGAGGGEEGNNGGDDESCGGTQDAGGSCLTSGSDGIALHGGNGDSNGIKGNAVSVFDYAGGLIGYNTGTTTSSYWNTETSEQAESNGGIGKTTAELKNQSTFVGWNFTDIWEMFSGEYPKLLAISADDPDDEDEIVYYTLTYTAGTGGTLTGSTTQSVVSGEDGTAVTAVPNSGYRFVRWSDNSTTNPRTDSNVNESFSISAIFERRSSGGSSIGSVAKPIISTTTPTTNLALSNCQLVDLLLNINVITQDKASPARNVLGCNSDMNTDIINGTTTKYYFPRNLKLGMIGDDVKELQKFLNMQVFLWSKPARVRLVKKQQNMDL